MKLTVIRPKEVAICSAIGAAGALIFLFAFPKGAISTLMHAVLHLPGPGAGIALIIGPIVIFVALLASLLTRGTGGALIASLTFAVASALVAAIFAIPTNPKGAFGSAIFIAAVALAGITAEAVMHLGKSAKGRRRCLLAGALANTVLLVFYWIAIFPRTYKPVAWHDVPLLTALALAAGLLFGYIAWVVYGFLSRTFALKEKR
ncbi:MAG TPA: hypothetical protein VM243_07555 [Phycisphaerae bacterium]|nr:hypothetical protein [Phycisphaerae bacterium]